VSNATFVYVTYIATTPEKVWRALLDGELTRQYLKREQVSDWRPGSDWKLVADNAERTIRHVGKFLECVPNKRLAVSCVDIPDAADPAKHSRVAIDIETVGQMVRVTVTHENLSEDMRRRVSNGWPRVLSSLKSFLETGSPLDVYA